MLRNNIILFLFAVRELTITSYDFAVKENDYTISLSGLFIAKLEHDGKKSFYN